MALLAAGVLGWVVYHYAYDHFAQAAAKEKPAKPVDINDVVKATVTALTLVGAVLAGLYAYRKQLLAEGDAHRADASQLADRYTTAAGQLGHDQAAVRLAGVYALARLADDWEEQRQVCIDVLCAYLRMPYEPDPTASGHKAGEREVRHTVIRVIRDHLQHSRDPLSWCTYSLDFTGAIFDGGDFSRSDFRGRVRFDGARFNRGTVSFYGARYNRGGTVSFNGAAFDGGTVTFKNTTLSGGTVNFDGAAFDGSTVTFEGTVFADGTVTFKNTALNGGTLTFERAVFDGGTLTFESTALNGGTVNFERAVFSRGRVVFKNTAFDVGWVAFERAVFDGGTLTFENTMFNGGTGTFERAVFSGGAVTFKSAMFRSGRLAFERATFEDGTLTFENTTFDGGTVTFKDATLSGGSITFNHTEFNGTIFDWGALSVPVGA
ncbi:pentapeptide repeat-containing protein [Streptomyces sp. NPDC058252]|uniref:pentapeptide repeat-containing protein n=1 Tax=Streptomyces sp. NPDC058252 TaxID=3346405 RepID=UPI0036E5E143